MINVIKNIKYPKKLSSNSNSKPKKRILPISSLTKKNKSNPLEGNTISPFITLNEERKIKKIKNFTLENNVIDISRENKNKLITYNTSKGINNSYFLLKNYIKKIYFNPTRIIKSEKKKFNEINNNNPKENKSYEKDFINYFNLEQNNKDNLNKSNYKEKLNRYKHKQIKREININNIIDNKFEKNKQIIHEKNSNKSKEHLKNSAEKINKRNKIPIYKRNEENNIFNNKQKNSSIYDFILNRKIDNIKETKNSLKEKENIELSDNNKQIYHLKNTVNKKLKIKKCLFHKNKNNSISNNEIYEKNDNKINLKENKVLLNIRDKNNEIYFNQSEFDETDTKINKVLHFETSINKIFNQFQMNDKNNANINLNKIHSYKNIKEKNENDNIVVNEIKNYTNINSGKKGNRKKIEGINNGRIDYNKIKKRNIFNVKNDNYLIIKKLSTNSGVNMNKFEHHKEIKKLSNHNNKDENINKEQNYLISSTINKKFTKRKKRAKTMTFNINNKKGVFILPILDLDLFYKLFDIDNFPKILFSFCVKDILLLNKTSLISKHVYKTLKPFIYTQIKINIKKYNEEK